MLTAIPPLLPPIVRYTRRAQHGPDGLGDLRLDVVPHARPAEHVPAAPHGRSIVLGQALHADHAVEHPHARRLPHEPAVLAERRGVLLLQLARQVVRRPLAVELRLQRARLRRVVVCSGGRRCKYWRDGLVCGRLRPVIGDGVPALALPSRHFLVDTLLAHSLMSVRILIWVRSFTSTRGWPASETLEAGQVAQRFVRELLTLKLKMDDDLPWSELPPSRWPSAARFAYPFCSDRASS